MYGVSIAMPATLVQLRHTLDGLVPKGDLVIRCMLFCLVSSDHVDWFSVISQVVYCHPLCILKIQLIG
jgi:hypothetical protein